MPRPAFIRQIQQLSLTLGISAGAAALEISVALCGRAEPALWDFSVAFLVVSLVALLAAPVSMLMPKRHRQRNEREENKPGRSPGLKFFVSFFQKRKRFLF